MLTAVFIIIILLLLIFNHTASPAVSSKGADRSKIIAEIQKLKIGGSDQWITIRSENINNPIILFLHGGPGTSQLTRNRRDTKDLLDSFIVVDWDQRGAGKSFRAIKNEDRMNIRQFISDTNELTLYLLNKFNKDRLILAGHSWGSVIGALSAAKYPELYYCYIGIGQIADMKENEILSYRWTLDQARINKDKNAVKALEKIGEPPYKGNWQAKTITQRRYLGKFGGEFHSSRNGAFGIVIKNLVFSSEYSLIDRINFFRGILGSMKLLWPELLEINLFELIKEFKIPFYLVQGKYDMEAVSEIALRYFDFVKAPYKHLFIFENSAHMPNTEERDRFNAILKELIKPSLITSAENSVNLIA